jgi:hypothetical protein
MTVNLSNMSMLSPFLQPAGALRGPITKTVIPALEQNIGPLGDILAPALSLGSQFIFNTPAPEALVTAATAIDPFTGEQTTTYQGDLGFFKAIFGQALQLFTPRIMSATAETINDIGPTSLYTGGYNSALEMIISKFVAPTNLRTARELVVNAIIKRLHKGERSRLYSQYLNEAQDDLLATAIDFNKATTDEEWARLAREGGQLIKKVAAEPLTDEEAMQRFYTWASRNAYQLLDRMPLDRMPSLIEDTDAANYGPGTEDLSNYMKLKLIDDLELERRDDPVPLVLAWANCRKIADTTSLSERRDFYNLAQKKIEGRLSKIMQSVPRPLAERIMKASLGQVPVILKQALGRQLGLTP